MCLYYKKARPAYRNGPKCFSLLFEDVMIQETIIFRANLRTTQAERLFSLSPNHNTNMPWDLVSVLSSANE